MRHVERLMKKQCWKEQLIMLLLKTEVLVLLLIAADSLFKAFNKQESTSLRIHRCIA